VQWKDGGGGQLAAGIAHEINNPMTYLAQFAEAPGADGGAGQGVRVAGGARAPLSANAAAPVRKALAEITRSRPQQPARERFDEMMEMLDERRGRRAGSGSSRTCAVLAPRARTEPSSERGGRQAIRLVLGDRPRGRSVAIQDGSAILGLLRAAAGAGEPLVNALWPSRPGRHTLRTRSEEGCGVVEVEDDGPGVAPEALPYIFDPFYTTKEVGQGTGLGLTISYQLLQRMGGRITVRSNTGRGTTFRVELPLAPS
jgi:signal transduction histidine kinase